MKTVVNDGNSSLKGESVGNGDKLVLLMEPFRVYDLDQTSFCPDLKFKTIFFGISIKIFIFYKSLMCVSLNDKRC